ncbi:unnamed protein product [Boreogadus saida]
MHSYITATPKQLHHSDTTSYITAIHHCDTTSYITATSSATAISYLTATSQLHHATAHWTPQRPQIQHSEGPASDPVPRAERGGGERRNCDCTRHRGDLMCPHMTKTRGLTERRSRSEVKTFPGRGDMESTSFVSQRTDTHIDPRSKRRMWLSSISNFTRPLLPTLLTNLVPGQLLFLEKLHLGRKKLARDPTRSLRPAPDQ